MKLALSLLLAAASFAPAQTTVMKAPFGAMPDGKPADLYTLKDAQLTVQITTYGAHIVSVVMKEKDRAGRGCGVGAPHAGRVPVG